MLHSIKNELCYDEKIEPFPVLAIIDQESNFSIFDTSEDSILQPEIRSSGQPFSIIVHPFGHDSNDKISGYLRWRTAGKKSWHKEPLIKKDDNKWEGTWTPPDSGNYEWNVELWTGHNNFNKEKSYQQKNRLLKVERNDLISAKWHQLDKNVFRNIDQLPEAQENDVCVLPVIFPHDHDGRVGHDGKGHYWMDPNITNPNLFGELNHIIASKGMILGMKFPIKCSNQHPFHAKEPQHFNGEGINDLISEGWEARRKKWENVFRFWIVQGIEVFSIPEITCFPLSFWDQTIQSLREDFPAVSFVTDEILSDESHKKMISAGFSDFEKKQISDQIQHLGNQLLIKKPDNSKSTDIIECTSDDDDITTNVEKITTRAFLLNIKNEISSPSRSINVFIKHKEIDLSDGFIYYARDLSNGRAYRWSGNSNEVFIKKGQDKIQLLIEIKN